MFEDNNFVFKTFITQNRYPLSVMDGLSRAAARPTGYSKNDVSNLLNSRKYFCLPLIKLQSPDEAFQVVNWTIGKETFTYSAYKITPCVFLIFKLPKK